MILRIPPFLVMALLFATALRPGLAQQVPEGFSITSVVSDLDTDAVAFTFLPDGRMLRVQKESGTVKLIVDGDVRPEPVITIGRLTRANERGLLGIAVDPDFPDSNYIYLFHSRDDSTNRVTRFAAEGDLNDAASDSLTLDPASEYTLISFPDTTRFHNAGTLRFGNDKTLYISHGDDAYADRVQSLTNTNGKIFRIHRDGTGPADNPTFPNAPPDALREIFAIGLRNPFRFNIDPATQALFIGDVGTNLFEEFNVAVGGENFGYPHYEGLEFFRPYVPLVTPDPVFPVYHYAHNRSAGAASAIALVAYRPVDYPNDKSFPPEYGGAYFHADFFDSRLRYLKRDSAGTWISHDFGSGFARLVDGSIGPDGSIYVLEYGGELFRIAYVGSSGVAVENPDVPGVPGLGQNYPNPFRLTTTITYSIPRLTDAALVVYDVLGRELTVLASRPMPAGNYEVIFDATALPSGIYFYRLRAGEYVETRRMVVAR